MNKNCLVSCFLVLLAAAQVALAQGPIVYNAALGTGPAAQCFSQNGGAVQVVDGELHVGPTAAATLNYFSRGDFAYEFDAGFAMEVAFRVVTAGCGPVSGNLRYAIQLSAVDDDGTFFAAHFCDSQIALVNTPNSPVDGINVVTTPYPVAGNTLVARVEAGPNSATLFVDGVPLLSVPRGTYIGPQRQFYFGDGTGAAGGEYYVSYCRATGSAPGCGTTSLVTVPSGCAGLGPLSFAGVVQPGAPATAAFTIPGSGGIPLFLVGPYAMQPPYCAAGCRFGLAPADAIYVLSDTVSVSLPAMSAFVGYPFAFQGARVLEPGACAFPLVHALTDVSVMTL